MCFQFKLSELRYGEKGGTQNTDTFVFKVNIQCCVEGEKGEAEYIQVYFHSKINKLRRGGKGGRGIYSGVYTL